MRASDEVVAYHEAGHAVACVLLGRNLVRVVLGGKQRGMFVVEEWPSRTRQTIEDEIVSFYAGPAAERIFSGRPVHATATLTVTICGSRRTVAGHESDGSRIFLLASRALGSEPAEIAELCRRLDARARELVAGAWSAVELVASELTSRRELSGAEVRELVRQAIPDEGGKA